MGFPLHVPSLFAPQPCVRCGELVDRQDAVGVQDETDDLFGGKGPAMCGAPRPRSVQGELAVNAPTLFDLEPVGRARRHDPETSKVAARSAPSWRDRILAALDENEFTDDQLCIHLGIPIRQWPSVKTARSALKAAGLVCWTGETRDGQRVWTKFVPGMPRVVNVDVRDGVL